MSTGSQVGVLLCGFDTGQGGGGAGQGAVVAAHLQFCQDTVVLLWGRARALWNSVQPAMTCWSVSCNFCCATHVVRCKVAGRNCRAQLQEDGLPARLYVSTCSFRVCVVSATATLVLTECLRVSGALQETHYLVGLWIDEMSTHLWHFATCCCK